MEDIRKRNGGKAMKTKKSRVVLSRRFRVAGAESAGRHDDGLVYGHGKGERKFHRGRAGHQCKAG